MAYQKYYDLEQYLFTEVGPNFQRNGALSAQDFFCIVIWKANRSKTKIRNRLAQKGPLQSVIRELVNDITGAQTLVGKLDALCRKWEFGIPMATAILTVLYSEVFSVYDYRVRGQLGSPAIYGTKRYFSEFLPKVQEFALQRNLSLRDADKELWGKSFYEDLEDLIKGK